MSEVSLGSSLVSVGESAFYGCTSLTRLILPNRLVSLGDSAFYGCTALESVTFGDGLKTIGDSAFYGCASLTAAALPAGVESIGSYAFRKCTALTGIFLGNELRSVGSYAFQDCENLTIYSEGAGSGIGWDGLWNSFNRPVVWGCKMSGDGRYLVSLTKGKIANTGAAGGIAAPVREGYVFDGWALSPDGEIAYSAEQLPSVPEGTVLYAIYSAETDAEA